MPVHWFSAEALSRLAKVRRERLGTCGVIYVHVTSVEFNSNTCAAPPLIDSDNEPAPGNLMTLMNSWLPGHKTFEL